MGATGLPNGVDINAAHTGNVAPYVTADGARFAAGSAVVTAGSVNVATGLSSVLYAVASTAGAVSSTAGTANGFVSVTAQAISGGTIILRGVDGMGTASDAAGTAYWFAVGT